MNNWPKVMEFCYQSWNLPIFAREFYQICIFFVTAKKSSNDLESLHFPTVSTKCCECKIRKRAGHGKSRNGYGKVLCQVCGNPDVNQEMIMIIYSKKEIVI